MTNPNDTRPNLRPVRDSVSAPPRFLLIGVMVLFVLVIATPFAGVWAFQNVLSPAQKQRVIDNAPFMSNFLQPTPVGGAIPTLEPDTASEGGALDLLNLQIGEETPEVEMITPEATSEATQEPTEVSLVVPTATPTVVVPTATAVPPTPTPTPDIQPTTAAVDQNTALTNPPDNLGGLPASARLYGQQWARQTWNNCGPATITTALSYYGWREDQTVAGNALKPNREDKNVSPDELVSFINNNTGVRAMARVGGNIRLLKALIANNFPVIIERGIFFEAYDWVGHYQSVVAYDDTQQVFYVYDSYLGNGTAEEGITESYNKLDEHWREFNRTFIVLYQQEEEGRVRDILGRLADPQDAAQVAFETAQQEAEANRDDPFAWFNMGSSLTNLGRYREAANAFDQSRRTEVTLPWRLLWYRFETFEAYYEMGRYDDILSLAQSNLNQSPELEESYYWRGRVYEARGEMNRAAEEYRRALGKNPNYTAARTALDSL